MRENKDQEKYRTWTFLEQCRIINAQLLQYSRATNMQLIASSRGATLHVLL